MFGFLKKSKGPSCDVYRPTERVIYHYWDGGKTVSADPMTLYRKVMEVGPELSIDLTVANSPSKDSGEAHRKAVEKVRTVFGVKGLEEGGLTEAESLDLLDHFMAFCEALKKNSSRSPTSPAATSATTASSSAAGSPTPSSSGSGSTANGPSTGPPGPSLTGVVSPSGP